MAKALDFNDIDELNKFLGDPRNYVSPKTQDNPQKEAPVVIEAAPLVEGQPEAIQQNNLQESPLGYFSRKNFNGLLDELDGVQKNLADNMNKRKQSEDSSAGTADKFLAASLRRANSPVEFKLPESEYNAASFQKSLKDQMDQLNSSPKDVDKMDQLIAAFGPGLLALATGGTPGAQAGMEAFKAGQGEIDRSRKAMAEERKAKIAAMGKQIEGTGKLLSAETERNKENLSAQEKAQQIGDKRFDFATEYFKWLHDNKRKDGQESRKEFLDLEKEFSGVNQKGIAQSVEIENKALDRTNNEKVQENRDNEAMKRAKVMAGASAKRALDKPPTEGQTSSANAYTSMTKAEQAYDRLLKDAKSPPSMSSKFFDTQKSVFENAKPGLLMGDLMKQIPDSNMRRQIQAELDWLAPHLRKVSGAAINPGEYIAEGNRFFPRNGDDAKTIAEKAASRKQTMENYRVGAGRAPLAPIQQPEIPSSESLTREQKIQRLKQLEGK